MKKLTILLAFLSCICFANSQPVINSFFPSSGPVGTIVTINGSNFNTTPTNNVVYFGAVRANVSASSTSQLTVTVPLGATYQNISVTNSSTGLTAYSSQPFIVTFTCGNIINEGSFAAKVDYLTGSKPNRSAICDLDGDGKTDIVVVNNNDNTVSVLKNTSTIGSISFASKVDFSTGFNPLGIAIGDIDGDSKPDLAITNNGANSISILKNTSTIGTISFAAKVDYNAGIYLQGIAIGDINNDGKPDIAVTHSYASKLSVLKNIGTIGTISFAAAVDFVTDGYGLGICIGDLDGDGKPDITATNDNSSVSVLKNTSTAGNISFAAKVDFITGSGPISVCMGDIDRDGKPDLVVANSVSNSVSLLKNTSTIGNLSFAPKADFLVGMRPISVTINDLNGDGKPDLAIANYNSNSLSVLKNTSSVGNIYFETKVDYTTGTEPSSVNIGDFDRDEKPDLAVANYYSTTVSVLKNLGFYPPIITSFAPSIGPVGTVVTINGENFNTILSKNSVFFGATQAIVSYADPVKLIVTVPYGATFQNLSVINLGSRLSAYSDQPFTTTYSGGGVIDTLSFAQKSDFVTGSGPYCVSVSDLNADGKSDLAVTNYNSNTVSVFKNTSLTGFSSFATKVDLATGLNPYSVSINDLNGDGKPDIVVSNSGSSTVSVYKNTSTATVISFATKIDFITGNIPYGIAVEDIDGDGKPDIVVANWNSNTFSVLKNQSLFGTISFASKEDFITGSNPFAVAIGDLNGDSIPDLSVTSWGADSVSVFKNTSIIGDISFAAKVDYLTGDYPQSISIGDIDGDGKSDIAIANWGSNSISILKNTYSGGNISFNSKLDYSTGLFPSSVAIGDLDGEGNADIVVSNYNSSTVSVFRNESSAGILSLSSKVDFVTGNNPRNVSIADIDGDGKSDIVVPNSNSGDVSVLKRYGFKPPVIDSFAPISGPVGTSVTIKGHNFNSMGSSDIVYFGATKADIVTASDTQLVVIAPLGATYQFISVTDISTNLTAYASTPFITNFPNGGEINIGSFAEQNDLISESRNYGITINDFDGDAKPDIAVSSLSTNTVSVLKNTSVNEVLMFAPKINLITGTDPQYVCSGDFDGDGKLDLVTANHGDNSISIFKNISSSTIPAFNSKIDYSAGINPYCVAVGNLDGDGKPDIAVVNFNSSNVSVYKNTSINGIISFAPKVNFVTGSYPVGVCIGDIDNDGKADICVANYGSNTVSILRNNSSSETISFLTKVDFTAGARPSSIAVGDLDEDGKPDIVVPNRDSDNIIVLKNSSTVGTIAFATNSFYPAGIFPYNACIGDLDGDAKPDIAVANKNSSTVSVFKNICIQGTISFAPKVDYEIFYAPVALAIGDLNGDAEPDIIVGKEFGDSISILKNLISYPPVITSFEPDSGYVNSIVLIKGANFNEMAQKNAVYFGATRANVLAASKSQLTVEVPYGSTVQNISVTDLDTSLTAFSSKPFITIFECGGSIDTNSFVSNMGLNAGNLPVHTVIADFDNDGKPDLVSVDRADTAVSIYRNTSAGGLISFGLKESYESGGADPCYAYAADIDSDGKLDLIIANVSASLISIFRNISSAGAITFAPRLDVNVGVWVSYLDFNDLDGDGKPEIAFTCWFSNYMSVLRNISTIGNIAFAPKIDYLVNTGSLGLTIADIEGDCKPEVITVNGDNHLLSIFRNTSTRGNISFAPKVNYNCSSYPTNLFANDIDGDGKTDIVIGNYQTNSFSIFRNISTLGVISLAPSLDIPSISIAHLAISDLDGDGKYDILSANESNYSFYVFKNSSAIGVISFLPPVIFNVNINPIRPTIGDLNGDEKPDLVIIDYNTSNVPIYENFINKLPHSASQIFGITTVCQNENGIEYNVPFITDASTYVWTLPSGATGTSTANQIFVDYGAASVSGNLMVQGSNTCGEGEAAIVAITVNPTPSTPTITLNGSYLHSSNTSNNQWYNQNGLISGATSQDYLVTSNGTYYVIASNQYCSSDTSNTINITNSGIESIDNSNFIKIFPNPVDDDLFVEIKGNTNELIYEIIDSQGKIITSGTVIESTRIPMKGISAGIYLIKLKNEATINLTKIIKE